MPLTPPVEELIAMLGGAGLARHGAELRAYLEAGVAVEDRPISQLFGEEGGDVDLRRRFGPREEVEAACAWLDAYLVGPYRQIAEAERIISRFGHRRASGAPPRRRLLLVDERFVDAAPLPAVTEAEWKAAASVARALPGARMAMLRALDDDDGRAAATPSDPIEPAGGGGIDLVPDDDLGWDDGDEPPPDPAATERSIGEASPRPGRRSGDRKDHERDLDRLRREYDEGGDGE